MNSPKDNENFTTLNNCFKLNTEDSGEGGNTIRNDDSTLNTKKSKKNKLIKNSSEGENIITRSPGKNKIPCQIPTGKQSLKLAKKEGQVNNIIININNQITGNTSSQQIQVNTINTMNIRDPNRKNTAGTSKPIVPKGQDFLELKIDNEIHANNSHADKVMEANQNKFFVYLNRLFFAKQCSIYYTLFIIICGLITILSFIDIFLNFGLSGYALLFSIQVVIIFLIISDIFLRFYVMVKLLYNFIS